MEYFLYSACRIGFWDVEAAFLFEGSQNKLVNKMVYCTKCGTKNKEDATICVKCKEPLGNRQTVRRERRRKENECFGLPHGGSIAGLVIGLIIILWGVTHFLGEDFGEYLWPFIIIIFGTLMVVGALYAMSRRR
ncbi:MAG: zinc ribbon domain-containing protein [Candidatus Bathyarchaeota archaeon]|nr:zinc ribbon domain-containing protein [Candidatus Bathyarchaeota archaeon]